MIDSISTADASSPAIGAAKKDDPTKVMSAAKQFEALLIGQMMKSMSDAEGGWLGTGDDESASSAMEYAQESFAQALAARGGLGISAMVAKGLSAASDNAPTAPAEQTSGSSRI